jgi:tungstate transport system ATP-binding protein
MSVVVPLYEIENLRFAYNSNFSLNISKFSMLEGDSVGFIGPNGSGKSSLLKIMAFLETFPEGLLKFKGNKVSNDNKHRNIVTMLLQEPYLLKKSVFDNIAYGLRLRNDTDKLNSRVFEVLNIVGLSDRKFAHRKWFELSGGEAQRVALASRLILRPCVLILDEPTANVDSNSAALIKQAVKSMRNKYNTSLIISSHDLVWLNSITDNILRLYEGRIVGTGSENLIEGPWTQEVDDLWSRTLNDRQKIMAVNPNNETSVAILNPSDIILSIIFPEGISAQNILKAKIKNMSMSNEFAKVKIELEIADITLISSITQHALKELHFIPGQEIWAVFKATSLHWQ